MNTKLKTGALAAALAFSGSAFAATNTYTDSLVVILAEGAADTAFVGGVNLPDLTRATIDQDTSDYGFSGSADGLITFGDLEIAAGSTIESATLTFFTRSFSDGPVNVYQMARDWGETDTYNTFVDGITAGADTTASVLDSATDLADDAPISFDVTAAVKAWVEDGAPNYGFGLINSSGDGWDIQVLAEGDGSVPTLSVDFAPIPVPAALPLMAGALGLFGAVGARRRRIA